MLTHLTPEGQPRMVDVGEKPATWRVAVAEATVRLPAEVRALFAGSELHLAKGPVLQTAVLAGTMAVKQTPMLIPLCHPIPLDRCRFETTVTDEGVCIRCEVGARHRTGVEMEALTGASVAALTIYDMCKAVSHAMTIEGVRLVSKRGGKRDV